MFLEKELSEKLMRCFYAVRNKYGNGHNERVYDRVLDEHFDIVSLEYISQPRVPIYSLDTEKRIAIYIPDKLVEKKVIIEIKAKPFTSKEDEQQLIEYLKTSEYEIGYLVNFGEKQFKPRRFIYTNDRKLFLALIK